MQTSNRRRFSCAGLQWLVLVALLVSFPRTVAAAGNPAAEALFREGRELMANNQIEPACNKFAESQRIEASTGTLLNLANCHAAQGKTATAWAEFAEALAEAQKEGDALRVEFAEKKIAELEPKLSKITVLAKGSVEGLSVSIDASPIALNAALPHDPGTHDIEATAPGKKPFRSTVELGANADSQTVTIPELELAPAGSADDDPTASTSAGSDTGGDPRVDRGAAESSAWRTPLGYTLGGLGVAALGAGTYLALSAKGDLDDAKKDPKLCPGRVCTPRGRKKVNGAETKANIATGALAGGVVAIGVGVYLLLSGDDSQTTAGGSRFLVPVVGRQQLGLLLQEEF